MEQHFDKELDKLRMQVLEMAAHAEKSMELAVRALLERNTELASKVIDSDQEINRYECSIDALSLRLLALAQPVAKDLRFITGIMRIIVNLERVGDQAVNVAERALILSHRPALPFSPELEELSAHVLEMLRAAIKAFKDDDTELSERVCDMDSKANQLDLAIIKKLINYMLDESPAIERSVHTILASRCMERVGDLSTNIAESVIFIIKGVDIKHRCSRT